MRGTNPERFFDQVARTLAEPMPRRRAVRLIGASLVAVAVPGVSPRIARAASTAGKCPDGSTCTDPQAPVCCSGMKSPLSGNYTCRGPTQFCCCGNTQCETATERCVCPVPGGKGGQCAPKCALAYGSHWTDCGLECCPPYKRCENGKCVSCEDKGKRTCSSYDNKSSHECCKPGAKCCADMTAAYCCGPKQTCTPAGRNHVKCTCNRSTDTKCGSDCCNRTQGETCCGGKECCAKDEKCCDGEVCCRDGDICCDRECCDVGTELCYVDGSVRGCVKNKKCVAPAVQCGVHCCANGKKCRKRRDGSLTCG